MANFLNLRDYHDDEKTSFGGSGFGDFDGSGSSP